MGVIRGGLLVIVSVAFLLGMLALNFFYTAGTSLEYNKIKTGLAEIVIDSANEEGINISEVIEEGFPQAQSYCKNNTYIPIDANNSLDFDVNISCESVGIGSEAVVEEFINESIEQVYYEEYNCNFAECLSEKDAPFYVLSEDFKDYLISKFYFFLLIVIGLFVLMFLLTENKANAFIIAGVLIVLSALPFMKIESFVSSISGQIFKFVGLIFSTSTNVFIRVLILGIAITSIGIVLRILNIGFKISSFFDKFKKNKEETVSKEEVKDLVKEEVSKAKKQVKESLSKDKSTIQKTDLPKNIKKKG